MPKAKAPTGGVIGSSPAKGSPSGLTAGERSEPAAAACSEQAAADRRSAGPEPAEGPEPVRTPGTPGSPVSEAELLDAIAHVGNVLSATFAFGYFDRADIKQQIALECLKALPRFDRERSLKHFMWAHCRNRLLNLQRDKGRRNDPPCLSCHDGCPCPDGDASRGVPCEAYREWFRRNSAKWSLAQSGTWSDGVASHHYHEEESPAEVLSRKELLEKIDREIPLELRGDYLRLKAGYPLSKARKQRVVGAVRELLGIADEGDPDEGAHGGGGDCGGA